ncbi:shufflon system plasmid conjugative transfer pilus tip adhesin PilV [Acetobacter papayae]|uniref:shufflon system plasmid conjugative transfer pilus tip adhesin PilV n=1 Tax=Acetobacter papayae TaxID=1076592 RepID=UPI00131F03A7|nr:shufflon system plasmid conjugative transfer pilus tip adhesin PilV [Acetobacter papayae]
MLGNLTSSEAHGTTWNLSLSGLPSPGAGHLFGTVTVGDAASPTIDTNDFLYRVGVPGHDELNTMGVALNMGSNNINNVGTINAEQGVFSGNVFAQSGNIIDLAATNIVSGGTVQTNRLSSASSDIVYLAARNVRIDENAQIYGTLNVNGRASMDAAITGTDGGNAIAGNACTDNGAIASSPDGTGTHLECVRGLWETLGGETSTTVSGSAGVYGSWTMIKTKDPTVPTGYRKRIMGESPWYSSSWGDHSFTIAFPEPFTAILPGAYGCALVSEGGGGHDNSPWLMSTPSLTQITVFVNWPTDGNGSDAMVTWWVEGY